MRYITLFITFFILAGCSFKSNDRYKYRTNSSNSFQSYTKYYLKGDTLLASSELRQAIKNAKEGSDINTLATIYLGECALHKAILIDDSCKEFNSIKEFVDDKTLQNYYLFINKNINDLDINSLPKRYQEFALYLKNRAYNKAFEAIKSMENISSKLIAAYLIKEHLTKDQIRYLIKETSSMGYKKATLRWYEFLKTKASNKERETIDKKLQILR